MRCILALTATATKKTEDSISKLLEIPQPDGVIRISTIRPNLHLSVSSDVDKYVPVLSLLTSRYKALIEVLKSSRFSSSKSTIIYCMLQVGLRIFSHVQNTADDLANYLQLHQFDAASYHAGKSPHERKRIQNLFMNDKLDIVVATVAFGMGIDKRNIRAVIHFNLPKSLENYVQVNSMNFLLILLREREQLQLLSLSQQNQKKIHHSFDDRKSDVLVAMATILIVICC